MIKILSALLAVVLLVALIGAYLSPDDLAQCEARPTMEPPACRPADAIVAVSGGDTSARTAEAVSLYKRGWANKLVFSGAAADKSGPSNARAMRVIAIASGVPESAIITEEMSETTHQNAQLSSSVLSSNDFRRVILVTSAYHQRRASMEFKNYVGGDTRVINHPVENDRQWIRWWWLTPTGWWLALSELIKIILVYIGAPR